MLNKLGVTKETPYFEVDGERVYVIWDPPHCIKNTRNNLKNSGYELDGDLISWVPIEELFQYDSNRNTHMCPKLTKHHIYLGPFGSKMRVRLATQTLSQSVAAGLETLADIKQYEGQRREVTLKTAWFCATFDKLFNVFNSRSLHSSRPMVGAITATSTHFQFLDDCQTWLPRLTVQGSGSSKQLPCIIAWQSNINSLKLLWADLQKTHGVEVLKTNRLNQDCNENLHCLIR